MPGFDPDAYLAADPAAGAAPPEEDHDLDFLKPGYKRPAAPAAPADGGFDPDAYLEAGAPAPEDRIGKANREYQSNVAALKAGPGGPAQPAAPAPDVSTGGAAAIGAAQGASLGWADELAAAADSAVSKIPGVRDLREAGANKVFGHPAGALDYSDPNLTYDQRRNAYRAYNEAAAAQHPYAHGAGEVAGGIATSFAPGMSLGTRALETAGGRILPAIAPSVAEVAGQGAALGTIAGAGASKATDTEGVARDALESGGAGAVGAAVLHPLATKVIAPLAQTALTKIAGKAASVADRQAVGQLARDVPQSLTNPMTEDAGLRTAINEPIAVGPKKTVTLSEIAGKPAEEVRPVIQAKQAQVDQKIAELHGKAGSPNLSDLANRYDQTLDEINRNPGNKKSAKAVEAARQDALKRWGPTDADLQGKLNEIKGDRNALYSKSDEAAGGATLGDLVKHYNDHIAQLAKMPGNEPYVDALTKARDSAVKAWGTRPIFDPNAVVEGGSFGGAKAGDAVAKLQKMAANAPSAADALNAEADRITAAATKDGFDPTVKVPAQDVRKYATTLQSEGATSATDPKLAQKARQFIGTTTKDFVNQHVGNTLGAADRKSLEALNKRTTNLLNWRNVVSGKETDPAVRNAVLKEFEGQKISPHDLDAYASQQEAEGAQGIAKLTPDETMKAKANLAKTTRDFANEHVARNLDAHDLAEYQRQTGLRASLKNIDDVVARRLGKENAHKMGAGAIASHVMGGTLGAEQIGHGLVKMATGDIGGGLAHVGGGVAAAALPFAARNAAGIGRAAVRGVASGADLLANVAAKADAGNPWARRQIDLLRQTPAGAARLAAALARMRGAGGGTVEGQ